MKLAGVEHHSSYEWNPESNATHNQNFSTENAEADIRQLKLSSLPKPGSIDIVVGSPPCTQFSFSNRGGGGNIEDGLIDLHKFLSIVKYLKPKYWAMENVPRVRNIIDDLVARHPDFKQFRGMITFNGVVNCWEYGVPQKRKRMICGHFPHELFLSYREKCPRYSMDDALPQLDSKARLDMLYGWPKGKVTDNEKETPLDNEETRINREAKVYHPVYNRMPFPDPRDRPARTVTSLCTRVSRESIVIANGKGYRRLSVRERGVLMGFPVSYQFYGNSHSSKLKMIGNAIPPPLTYHLFNAMAERDYIPLRSQENYVHKRPSAPSPETSPPVPKQQFKPNRSFRMCVSGYRFGSGVRFELSNLKSKWRVRFFYGSSTNIHEMQLDDNLKEKLVAKLPKKTFVATRVSLKKLSGDRLQSAWTGKDGVHPFIAVDELGLFGEKIKTQLPPQEKLKEIIEDILPGKINRSLLESPETTVSGLILGVQFNETIKEMESNAD